MPGSASEPSVWALAIQSPPGSRWNNVAAISVCSSRGGGVVRQHLEQRQGVGQRPCGLVKRPRADGDIRVADLWADAEAHCLDGQQRFFTKQTHQRQAQVEHDALVRERSAGPRNDALTVELKLEFLPVLPGEEALGGPRPVQYGVHARIIAKGDARGRPLPA